MQDESFWNFSVKFYAIQGVADICLDLQDRFGFDVNVLLYMLWQARHQRRLGTKEIQDLVALIAEWQRHVVRPLRGARRFLTNPGSIWSRPEVAELRQRLKGEELLAERLQQAAMEAAFLNPGETADIAVAARANCEAYARILSVEFPDQHLSVLLGHLSSQS